MDSWLLQLAIIGVVEGIILLFVSFSLEKLRFVGSAYFSPRSAKLEQWLAFLLLSLVFGLTYDVLVGNLLGIFSYPRAASLGALTYVAFLILNSTISYGVFACTVAMLPFKLQSVPSRCSLPLKLSFRISILAYFVAFSILSRELKVFSVGAIILFSSEIALLMFARLGPIAAHLKCDPRLFLMLWGFSVSIGNFIRGCKLDNSFIGVDISSILSAYTRRYTNYIARILRACGAGLWNF